MGTFLPKQMSSANGVIPNQLYAQELKKILEKASKYYPFLTEKDQSGLTVKEQIMQMFAFQIPYYIGPLANINKKGNGWMIRNSGKEYEKIYPWNFEEVINEKETANEFIKRMIRNCTYLGDEKVLPKESLLYQKYSVLNEINSLKIDGIPIRVEQKQKIYNDLFTKGKRVTGKALIKYLKMEGVVDPNTEPVLSGFDIDFKNTLSSYRKFCDVFQTKVLSDDQIKIAEDIIEWSTVFGDSKKFIKEKIMEKYPSISKKELKRILSLNFKDWGNLSKEFLEIEGEDLKTGEIRTIIQSLWETNYNLMQLLSEGFSYKRVLESKSKKIEKSIFEFTPEDLEELYISAPVKRMVWQAVLILKDIVKVMKSDPTKLFVEMTRENGEKKRTTSRKNQLIALYRNIKDESRDWINELTRLNESEFRIRKLYLYYTQMGRDMYSGDPIDLKDLFNNNLYDIDHIYPRRYVKDDSLSNNLVLVRKEDNAHKKDIYPLEKSIQQNSKVKGLWKYLLKNSLITQEKFNRLTRVTGFTDSELGSFVNRQLVETGQATKTITDVFKNTFPNSEVVYVKSGNVSDFRKQYDILKCRSVNNLHHAQDAYLNIVVGNVYNTKFTKDPRNYIKELKSQMGNEKYHMNKIFDYTVERNGIKVWMGPNSKKGIGEKNSIDLVRKMVNKTSPLVTKKSYEYLGELSDATITSAKEAKIGSYLPTKTKDSRLVDVTKYGGMKNIKGTRFFLVEHTSKKGRIRTIEFIPLYLKDKLDSKEALEEYARKELGLIDPDVRMKCIKLYSLLNIGGVLVYLTARTGNRLELSNASELYVNREMQSHIRDIEKYIENGYIPSKVENSYIKNNVKLYDILKEKHQTVFKGRPYSIGKKLETYRNAFLKLSVLDQSIALKQILKATSTNEKNVTDLHLIGGGTQEGTIRINKNITSEVDKLVKEGRKPKILLINQSPTGLFENKVDLLTV